MEAIFFRHIFNVFVLLFRCVVCVFASLFVLCVCLPLLLLACYQQSRLQLPQLCSTVINNHHSTSSHRDNGDDMKQNIEESLPGNITIMRLVKVIH